MWQKDDDSGKVHVNFHLHYTAKELKFKRLTMSWTIDDQEKAKLALATSDILTFQFLLLNIIKKGAQAPYYL